MAPAAPKRRRNRSGLPVLITIVVVIVLAVGLVVVDPMGVREERTAIGWRNDASAEDLTPPANLPDPSDGATATTAPSTTTTTAPPNRLAPPPAIPEVEGAHGFLGTERDGDPITWDPCETIQYVVNSRRAPPGAAEILAEAMAEITQATGLVFEDRGPSDEAPHYPRATTDAGRYGEGWSPVLIAWSDGQEFPRLVEEQAAGFAGPAWMPTGDGEQEHVTGDVVLDGEYSANVIDAGGRGEIVHLVMHELGHLIGLAHVSDINEVMYDGTDGAWLPDWGAGDLTGLAKAGTGDCDPSV